jgi:hypothetical protein
MSVIDKIQYMCFDCGGLPVATSIRESKISLKLQDLGTAHWRHSPLWSRLDRKANELNGEFGKYFALAITSPKSRRYTLIIGRQTDLHPSPT